MCKNVQKCAFRSFAHSFAHRQNHLKPLIFKRFFKNVQNVQNETTLLPALYHPYACALCVSKYTILIYVIFLLIYFSYPLLFCTFCTLLIKIPQKPFGIKRLALAPLSVQNRVQKHVQNGLHIVFSKKALKYTQPIHIINLSNRHKQSQRGKMKMLVANYYTYGKKKFLEISKRDGAMLRPVAGLPPHFIVAGKKEARDLAKRYNATPWNF